MAQFAFDLVPYSECSFSSVLYRVFFISTQVTFTVSLCLLMQSKTGAPDGPSLLADIYHYYSSSSESSGSLDEKYASELALQELQGPGHPLQKYGDAKEDENYSRLVM